MLAEDENEEKNIFVAIEQPKNGRILKRHYPLDRNTKKKKHLLGYHQGKSWNKLEEIISLVEYRIIVNKKQTFCF